MTYKWSELETIMEAASTTKCDVYWRHDIDLDLQAAVDLAELQHGLGITAHYFIMADSCCYNPRSSETLRAVRELRTLGHNIGLHVHPHAPRDAQPNRKALHFEVAGQAAALNWAGIELDGDVSIHTPPTTWRGIRSAGRYRIVDGNPLVGHYTSDSYPTPWRSGHPIDVMRALNQAQILIHPANWQGHHAGYIERAQDKARNHLALMMGEVHSDGTPTRLAV